MPPWISCSIVVSTYFLVLHSSRGCGYLYSLVYAPSYLVQMDPPLLYTMDGSSPRQPYNLNKEVQDLGPKVKSLEKTVQAILVLLTGIKKTNGDTICTSSTHRYYARTYLLTL